MYQRIRDLREDRDLTRRIAVEILNCPVSVFTVIMNVVMSLIPYILIKLAEFHNTSVDYLLNLTDDKRPYPRKRIAPLGQSDLFYASRTAFLYRQLKLIRKIQCCIHISFFLQSRLSSAISPSVFSLLVFCPAD